MSKYKEGKDVAPSWHDQIGFFLQPVSRLEAAGTTNACYARIFGLQNIQPELADEIEGLEIIFTWFVIRARTIELSLAHKSADIARIARITRIWTNAMTME